MSHLLKSIGIFVILTMAVSSVSSRPKRPGQIPNGAVNKCANCHIDPAGGGPRNPFGQMVEANFLNATGDVIWGPALASLDADSDGVSNGLELQDPNGLWAIGQAAPGNSNLGSLPGAAGSKPPALVQFALTLQLSNMNPHVGQKFEMRVVDKATQLETGRVTLPAITAPQFDVGLAGLNSGGSYFVDFYADLNGNGLYDNPPTDHAWRMEANNVQSDVTLSFVHNTTFTDIQWNYLFTLALSNMTPHVGQELGLRVIDTSNMKEVGRTQLVVTVPNFLVTVPGLMLHGSYQVDFYADLNKNGRYDAPPADHAWRLQLTDVPGDAALNFVHNTTFTDIDWTYLFTLQLNNMNPHLGQLFELRVVDSGNGSEVGRTSVPSVLLPNFAVKVPGIRIGKDYMVDYYADLSRNGTYNPPPTDHAWRNLLTNNSGDTTLSFVHNTSFTDIQWPPTLAVEPKPDAALPEAFALEQNYPNPFNPETRISFSVAKASQARLQVFNTLGELVRTLSDARLPAGDYGVAWDGRDDSGQLLGSGVYFYRLDADGYGKTMRMLLMK